MRLNSILQSYLDKTLFEGAITGGEATPSNLENQILTTRLEKNSKFNNNLIITFIVILLLSFCLICLLIWYFIPDKVIVMGLLSGEGLSILLIIKTIHRLYKDKVFTDHLLYLMPQLTNEAEKIKYIETIYNFLK